MLLPQALTGPMVWPQALCLHMLLTQVRRGPIVLPQVLGLHMLLPQVIAGSRRPNKTTGDPIKQWQRWWGQVAPQGLGTRVCECGTSPDTVV